MPESTRAWIYRVATAVVPLLTAYGILSERQAALWLSAISTLLVSGLAARNTSTKKPGTVAPPAEPADADRGV